MSSFRPFKILCEVTKRRGSTFFYARNYCKDRGVEEKLLNLPETNCAENAHKPKTNPQHVSPPDPANSGWWSVWGNTTKAKTSNLIPPSQDTIFTCVKNDTPNTAVSVESGHPLSWCMTRWVSFLNKFGIQQVGETDQDTFQVSGQEQSVCGTRDDGLHSFTPYTGNDSQVLPFVNQAEWLSLQDLEVSQPCDKCDGPSLHTQETFQIAQIQQIENQANSDFQEAPVLHTQTECNSSLPHRHITQSPQYSKKMCSVQMQYSPFLKGRGTNGGVTRCFYSTGHAPTHLDNLKPPSAITPPSLMEATPPIANKPSTICIEKPLEPDTTTTSIVPLELPLCRVESQVGVVDNCPSMIAAVAEKPPLPTSIKMSPSGTKHTLQLDDSSNRNIIAPEIPLSIPVPIVTDSVKSPTMPTSGLVNMPIAKLSSSNILTLPTTKASSINIKSPLPEAIKKDQISTSQMPPIKFGLSSIDVDLPRKKKKPPSIHKQQVSCPHTRSQTPMPSKPRSSIPKVQPVKDKTQKQSSLERLPTSKPYSSTTKSLNKDKSKISSFPQRSISPKSISFVTKASLPKVKIKPPSTPAKLPQFKTFSFTTKTLDNAKNRTPTKLQKPSPSKAFPSSTKTPLPQVKNKLSTMRLKLPVPKTLSSTTKTVDNTKTRTLVKLQEQPSSKAFSSTTNTPLSEVKKKPSSTPAKLPQFKTLSSTSKTSDNAKGRTPAISQKPPSSKAFLVTTKTSLPQVKKKPSSITVKWPASKTLSSTSKTSDNAKGRTPIISQKPSSSKAFPSTTMTPLSEVKKNPSSITVKLPASKTLSSTSKTSDNAKSRTPTISQKPSSSKAFLVTTKTPLSEVKKKPSSITVKLPASKTSSSTSKTSNNAKGRTPTISQKPSLSKAFPSTSKTPLSEVKKKPSSITVKLSASKTLSSTSKTSDNAKNRTPTKLQKSSSSKAFSSTTKTQISEVKKKPSSIPVKLSASKTSTSKTLDNANNRTPIKLHKLSSSKALVPTTKAPLFEVKKKKLPSMPVKLSGTKTFSSSTKILNNAQKSTPTKFQNSPASKAFSSSSKATLPKTKQIPPLSKTPKHGTQLYDQLTPSSFAHIEPTTKRFSSSTKAPFTRPKTVQTRCGQVTQRSEAFCSTTTTELLNLKLSPPTNIKQISSSKSFSSITQASLSNLHKIPTSRTKAPYPIIINSTTNKRPFFNSSKKKPPSSQKEQSPSASNTSVEAAFYSTDNQSSAAASDEKDPLKTQSGSGLNKVKDQSHCRRRPGECLPLPKGQRKIIRSTPPEHIRVCPPRTIKREASCKGLRLPGCATPTSISCLRHEVAQREPCTKPQAPRPSFSECIREMPKPPLPTECCTSERYRYLQPSEPIFFPRSTTISPPVVEPYIDPCKGECCTPITVSRDPGDGDSPCNETMGKNSTSDLSKAAVYDCLFQGKKLYLPGCTWPKSTVCKRTAVAVREPCTRPLAPVPSFSECFKRPFPKRPFKECRVATQKAHIMADVLARGKRLTLEAIFEARCKKPGLTKTCEHHEDEAPCGPTTPPRDCAKELPKSKPNRSCIEKVVEKCHAVPYKMSD